MKILLLLLSLVTLAWCQDRYECLCGMFITTEAGLLEVHSLPPIDLASCDEGNECLLTCLNEWQFVFNNGGLNYQRPGSQFTMGEECCQNLAGKYNVLDLAPTPVYNYYKLCTNPWMWDAAQSPENLCCVEGSYPGVC